MLTYLQERALYPRWISDPPNDDLQLIAVIPCYNEPDLLNSLLSIYRAAGAVVMEVIVVINHAESDSEEVKWLNQQTYIAAKQWSISINDNNIKYYFIEAYDLPDRRAGVGLARKIGMDEAVRRFVEVDTPNGIIVCYDADSECSPHFFRSVSDYFNEHENAQAVSIHYEHPIEGNAFSPEIYQNIIQYELHLRYYIEMQRYLMLPYAYHTVGSSLAVRVSAYAKVGGMNQRKAGEDFYFIHKCIKAYPFGEVNNVQVIPSPRESDRVPFGTGRAVSEMISANDHAYHSYHPQSFYDLDEFLTQLSDIYVYGEHEELEYSLQAFLDDIDYRGRIQEIKSNTSNFSSFYKRFYRWFDAFVLMKYLHYRRDTDMPDIPVEEAIDLHFWDLRTLSSSEKLQHLRDRHKNSDYSKI